MAVGTPQFHGASTPQMTGTAEAQERQPQPAAVPAAAGYTGSELVILRYSNFNDRSFTSRTYSALGVRGIADGLTLRDRARSQERRADPPWACLRRIRRSSVGVHRTVRSGAWHWSRQGDGLQTASEHALITFGRGNPGRGRVPVPRTPHTSAASGRWSPSSGRSIRARHRPVSAHDVGLARWAGTGSNPHLPW